MKMRQGRHVKSVTRPERAYLQDDCITLDRLWLMFISLMKPHM